MATCIRDGAERLSTLTSEKQRCEERSKSASDWVTISPDWRKPPKKQKEEAAHNILAFESFFQARFNATEDGGCDREASSGTSLHPLAHIPLVAWNGFLGFLCPVQFDSTV